MRSDNSSGVFVAWTEGDVFVRVIGRGTYQNAEPVRQFAKEWMEKACQCFHVDLAQCAGMDSTFLGVLAGLGLKLRARGRNGGLHLFNAGNHNLQTCQSLGLDQLGRLESGTPDAGAGPLPPESAFRKLPDTDLTVLKKPKDKAGTTRLMLEAHEDLCRADERNEAKFKDVKQFLLEEAARGSRNPTKES
jgi:anti-anti-sigma regulatory factor